MPDTIKLSIVRLLFLISAGYAEEEEQTADLPFQNVTLIADDGEGDTEDPDSLQ